MMWNLCHRVELCKAVELMLWNGVYVTEWSSSASVKGKGSF